MLAACGGSTSGESASSAPASEGASTAASSPAAPSAPAECANDTLKLGTLLPATGDLAFLGPPMFAAVDVAVAEIDGAGGVLGKPVVLDIGDSGDTSTDVASQTVDAQLAKGIQVILGVASSGVSLTVIDKITGNGVLQISPANTAPALTAYEDNGLYFRTAPSDVLQGAVLGQVAADEGYTSGATIAREDPYGEGLQDAFVANFEGSGGTITSKLSYDPAAADFAAEVAGIKAGNPEFVVVIGFDETVNLVQEMIKQGVGPQDVQIFFVDGNISATAYKEFPADVMKGVKASVPTGDPSIDLDAFNKRLADQDSNVTDFAYGAQSFDAVVLVALAAEYAGCADAAAIAAALPQVANADAGGESCATYSDCLEIIKAGGQPNYDGVSGPLDFNEFGDPKASTISVVEFTSNTEWDEVEVIGPVDVPTP